MVGCLNEWRAYSIRGNREKGMAIRKSLKDDPFIANWIGIWDRESKMTPDGWLECGDAGSTEDGVCWEEEEFHLELCIVQSLGSARTPMSKLSAYWTHFWWAALLTEADDFRVSLLKLACRGKWAKWLFLSDGIHVLSCAGEFARVLLKLTTYTLIMLKINLLTLTLNKIIGRRLEDDFG